MSLEKNLDGFDIRLYRKMPKVVLEDYAEIWQKKIMPYLTYYFS